MSQTEVISLLGDEPASSSAPSSVGYAKSLAGTLKQVTTFEAFRGSLKASSAPKWKAFAGEPRWKHVSIALKLSGYEDGDFQDFLRDVALLGYADFLASLPTTATPRARAALKELLDIIRDNLAEKDVERDLDGMDNLNMRVQAQMTVERIFDLNTLTQTFGCQLFIEMFWPLPSWEQLPKSCENDGDWEPCWSPKFRVRNLVEEMVVTKMFRAVFFEDSWWIASRQRHLVRLYELMNLRSFPVDCQHLNICVQSMLPKEMVIWAPVVVGGEKKAEAYLDANRCLFNDFNLITEIPFTSYMAINTADPARHLSCIHMRVNVRRNLFFYFVNVAVVIFLISSFVFCAFGVHPAEIQGRQETDFTIILTAVAFKLVLSSMLPSVSYVTRLDTYVLSCLLMVTVVTVVHTIMPHYFYTFLEMSVLTALPDSIGGEQDLLDADRYVFLTFAALWLAFNVIFWTTIQVYAAKEFGSFCAEARQDQVKYSEQGMSVQASNSGDPRNSFHIVPSDSSPSRNNGKSVPSLDKVVPTAW